MTVNRILSAVLGVQALLAVVTWWPEPEGPPPTPVVPFPVESIQEVTIESLSTRARGEDLVLARKGDGWVLKSAWDFPVIDDKVDEQLEALAATSYRTPIATNPIRHGQLNVPDDRPTRRITMKTADAEHVVLLGAASGKRMNVRIAGEDQVYEVEGMGAWAMADSNIAYLERSRLLRQPEQLRSVRIQRADEDFELVQGDEGWALADLGEDEVMDTGRMGELLDQLFSISIANPVDPALASDEPDVTVTWTEIDGTTGRYTVMGRDGDSLIVHIPPDPPFKMASVLTSAELLDTSRDDLVRPADEEASGED